MVREAHDAADLGKSAQQAVQEDRLAALVSSSTLLTTAMVTPIPLHRVRSFLPKDMRPAAGETPLNPEYGVPTSRMNSLVSTRIGALHAMPLRLAVTAGGVICDVNALLRFTAEVNSQT